MNKECCGNCKYRWKDGSDWICACVESNEYSDCTDYEFVCGEWEERSTK